jgi:hypothetical protein
MRISQYREKFDEKVLILQEKGQDEWEFIRLSSDEKGGINGEKKTEL